MTSPSIEPRTEAGREILASNRRVIEQMREAYFPHMIGEPIEDESLRKLVVMAENGWTEWLPRATLTPGAPDHE